jgi:hypothetical protein
VIADFFSNPFLLWIVVMIVAIPWILYKYDVLSPGKETDSPIISSQGLLESRELTSMSKGSIEGYAYNLLVTGSGRVIAFIQLHHNTKLHIVAVGDRSGINSVLNKSLVKQRLRRIELEGDFPNYFQVYCNINEETELLELFDPTDMAYFADFCRAYDFELFHDTIYISQASDARDQNYNTTMVNDVGAFLKRNHRLLKRLGAE